MGETTVRRQIPADTAEFHEIQARAYRLRGLPGDEAWALTHEHLAKEIRSRQAAGNASGGSEEKPS